MFRQLVKSRLLCHPNARLAILPLRCLGKTSTIDPDSSADKSRNAKSTGQRSDDLFESLFELGRSAENFAGSAETQSAPIAAREPFSESTRFAASARPNYRTDSRPHYARERESTPRPAFAPISAKPTDEELQQHLNRSVQGTGGLKSFNHLLDSIKPALKELEPHQFAIVFEKLHEQIGFLKRHKNIGLYWSAQTLRESASFAALLNQTNSLIDDLSTDDLAVLFKLLRSISHDPESAIVKSIVQLIDKRLDEMDLDLLSRFLLRTNLYLRKFPATGHLVRLRANLLENCRRRILNNELNAENFDQLSALFYNFLESCQNEDAFEMVEQLTQTILSDCDLDFNKAVLIASDILTALRGTLAGQNRYPHQLTELIDRCNSTIIESLESNPDATGDHYFFLDMVHRNRSRIYVQFRDFFSPKLLDLMGSFLAREHEANRKIRDPVSVLNLVHNYANVNVFNQKLIELVCSLITSGEYPRDRLSSSDYFMLSEHRWPFVDQQRLLSVFKSSDRFLQNLKNRNRDQGLFCDLILSEVNDPGLLNYLNQALSSRKEAPSIKSSTMRFYNYMRVALARVCLSMFTQLADQELQRKIRRTLDQQFHQLCMSGHRPNVSVKYISIDNRLQHPGYLSNGVFVNAFAIYDKSIGDLIPLEPFRRQFDEINYIPLTDSQELLAFIPSYPIRGEVPECDTTYNYQLKRVFHAFNLKTIEINVEDFRDLEPTESVRFHIEKALDSYK